MAELYRYITESGVIMPDTADLKAEVEAEYRAALGRDLALDPESPQGRLIAVETEARDAVVRNNAELAGQINPTRAGGVFLDAIAALTALARRSPEPSTVVASLSGVPETIIPAGSRVATEAGDVFRSRAATALDNNGAGTLMFFSETYDAVPAPAGSLTRILDHVLGWEGVTNAEPAVLGQPAESDAVFRKRREDTLFLQGVALPGAVMSGVLDVPGVRSMAFRENYTAVEQVVDGVTMPPHSIYAVVDGGTDEDVAAVLFRKKSLGCGYAWRAAAETTGVEVAVRCPESGQAYAVRFDRPEPVPLRAIVTAGVMGASTGDYADIIRRAVVDYADDKLEGLRGFRVGISASPFEMAVAVGMADPAIFVVNVLIGPLTAADSELAPVNIPMQVWQKAVITSASINVTGV
jgi:hypothetical protein